MTILSCAEVPFTRKGDADGVTVNDNRRFLVKSDSAHESIFTIGSSAVFRTAMTGSSILDPYLSGHPQNPYAYCKKIDYANEGGRTAYQVGAYYDSKPITRDDRDRAILNPCDRRAKYRWDKKKTTTTRFYDVEGKAVCNAAGEWFDPPPEKEETNWIFRVEKNLPVTPAWLGDYEDTVNDADITIFGGILVPKRCARFVIDDLGTEHEENGFTFFTVKFSLELKRAPVAYVGSGTANIRDGQDPTMVFPPTGWALYCLYQGLKVKKSVGSTERVNMKDDNSQSVTSPLPLDADGLRLVDPKPTTVIYLAWRQYDDADYSVFPLNET